MRAIDIEHPPRNRHLKQLTLAAAVALSLLTLATAVHADAVVDWSAKSADILVAHRLGPPPANRAMAIVQVSVFEAVNAITRRYPRLSRVALDAPAGASVDAAIAAASATALSKLAPSQQAAIDAAYPGGADGGT